VSRGPVVVLAGGTGGAKLARGLLDHVGEDLVVIANTGDDIEIYGVPVSPDPDLISFTLADLIDSRGWGIAGDTFHAMDGLRRHGSSVWFNLGDRDIAWCAERRRLLERGSSPTRAMALLTNAIGVEARVLPMTNQTVHTQVQARGSWHGLQQFLIAEQGKGPVDGVRLIGIEEARPSAEVLEAIAGARAIIIGPSNPVISIGPILELSGLYEALLEAPAPVLAVSPIVAGAVLKGPTAEFMKHAGLSVDAAGIAAAYEGLIDGLMTDEPVAIEGLKVTVASTLMDSPQSRRIVARNALAAAEALSL
jgi:LPPG:FO 2-phospho-L-lactate transferase